MTVPGSTAYRFPLSDYEQQAESLQADFTAGDLDAAWRVRWQHPRFRDAPIEEVRRNALDLADARTVVARDHGFTDWPHLLRFAEQVVGDPVVSSFENAVEAIVSGDLDSLQALLRDRPELIRARSARAHHATLLHYLAANGVEGVRQRTPPNAVEIARTLLDAGAEVDALADMYDERCTTMSMLVSSSPPAEAGFQGDLAELLLDYGAALEGRGSKWHSALMTAMVFGFLDTARRLAARGAPVTMLAAAAGLGRVELVREMLPASSESERHEALALSAQLGQADVVRLLLDAGEDPNRHNPPRCHAHATPLHQAVAADHREVVRLMVERGARMDIRDTIYDGTPLDWAKYLGRREIADFLAARNS